MGSDQGGKFQTANTLITAASSLAALVLAAYTLLFLVRPGLKPVEEVGVAIQKVEPGGRMSRAAYSEHFLGVRKEDIATAQKNEHGILAYIKVEFRGLHRKHGRYSARLAIVEPNTLSEEEAFGKGIPFTSDCPQGFSPTLSQDSAVLRCWVSIPAKTGTYQIKAEIDDFAERTTFDPRQIPLFDLAFSKPFKLS
jgi:hypothetical protein